MNIWKNDYKKICQENIDESVKLRGRDYSMITRMTGYIFSHNISLFEMEVIKKDLIGLAKEAELSGSLLEETLGVPEKEFCDSLMDGGMRRNVWDKVILTLKEAVLGVWLMHVLIFVFLGCPKDFGFLAEAVFYGVVFGFLEEWAWVKTKTLMYTGIKNKVRVIYSVIYFILLSIWVAMPLDLFIVRGNGWIITAIVTAAYILSVAGNNYYWNSQSKKYNWR